MQTLLTGKLIRDAESKTSQKGTAYLLLMVKTSDELVVRANLFGDDAQALSSAKRGDAVALVGDITIGIWQKSASETLPSVSMMAHRAISASERKAYKPKPEQSAGGEYQRPFQKFTEVASKLPKTVNDLSDDIPWSTQNA